MAVSVKESEIINVSQVKTKEKVFFPNLDGLRFFCFLGVFLYHSFATNDAEIKSQKFYWFVKDFLVANGNLGVNFFFVLSGFLITYLLLVEQKKYHNIRISNFYVRRILRIWPLFYLCVFFGFFIFPKLKLLMGETSNETATIYYYLVFLNNFDFLKHGVPDSSTLSILWSVAIEEQFYLLWPLLLYLVPKRYYAYTFAGMILCSLLFRWLKSNRADILELHTFSCISDMTVGGLFAYLSLYSKNFIKRIKTVSRGIWIALYLVIVAVFLFRDQIFNHAPILIALNRLIISILFGLVIIEQNYADRSFYKMSKYKLLSKLGTYTYGLYCLHMIAILIADRGLILLGLNRNIYEVIFVEGLLSLGLTICLALLSYHLIESRFLKLKTQFARITR